MDEIISTAPFYHDDEAFNTLYPTSIRMLAKRHWTPLHITRKAIDFFGSSQENRILDIGSGVGKFCLAAAAFAPNSHFFGIEQRNPLVEHALGARKLLGLKNVSFLEGNFTKIDMKRYDHFYFFNSFHENIDDSDRIDEEISYSPSLYEYYIRHLHNGLRSMPSGTKIVTYHTLWEEIPKEYRLMATHENGALNFWMKH